MIDLGLSHGAAAIVYGILLLAFWFGPDSLHLPLMFVAGFLIGMEVSQEWRRAKARREAIESTSANKKEDRP